MAISRNQLVKELEPGLNARFGLEDKQYEDQAADLRSIIKHLPDNATQAQVESHLGEHQDELPFIVFEQNSTVVNTVNVEHNNGGIVANVINGDVSLVYGFYTTAVDFSEILHFNCCHFTNLQREKMIIL